MSEELIQSRRSYIDPVSRGDSTPLYNEIQKTITDYTKKKRAQLKSSLDDFCTFWWRGIDAFETFGAFIINKNDLKFYNGPGFSNSYTNPQFESAAGQLTGVSFKTQQISFNIGVYWISIEHYRQLIFWLHPYEVNTLAFGFDHNYYYQVKLANIADSTRTVIGKESVPAFDLVADTEDALINMINADYLNKTIYYTITHKVYKIKHGEAPTEAIVNGEYYAKLLNIQPYNTELRYYTELKLTFEIQGTPCAYRWDEYKYNTLTWMGDPKDEKETASLEFSINPEDKDAVNTDLSTPIQANFAIQLGRQLESFVVRDTSEEISGYNLRGSKWQLMAMVNFPSTTIDIPTGLSFTTQGNLNENYSGVKIDPTTESIYVYKQGILQSGSPIYHSSRWGVGSDENGDLKYAIWQFNTTYPDTNTNILESNDLLQFLLDNNIILYYQDMKLNLSLSVGAAASAESDELPLKELFNVTLKNLTWGTSAENTVYNFNLGYDSEAGLLYLTSGDSEYFLLNTLSTSAKGQRIVDSMLVKTFSAAGLFEDPYFDIKNLYFVLKAQTFSEDGTITSEYTITNDYTITGAYAFLAQYVTVDRERSYISMRGRTNLI